MKPKRQYVIARALAVMPFPSVPRVRTATKFPTLATFQAFRYTIKHRKMEAFNKQYRFLSSKCQTHAYARFEIQHYAKIYTSFSRPSGVEWESVLRKTAVLGRTRELGCSFFPIRTSRPAIKYLDSQPKYKDGPLWCGRGEFVKSYAAEIFCF